MSRIKLKFVYKYFIKFEKSNLPLNTGRNRNIKASFIPDFKSLGINSVSFWIEVLSEFVNPRNGASTLQKMAAYFTKSISSKFSIKCCTRNPSESLRRWNPKYSPLQLSLIFGSLLCSILTHIPFSAQSSLSHPPFLFCWTPQVIYTYT